MQKIQFYLAIAFVAFAFGWIATGESRCQEAAIFAAGLTVAVAVVDSIHWMFRRRHYAVNRKD